MFRKSKWFKVFWLAPIVFSLLLAASVNDATETPSTATREAQFTGSITAINGDTWTVGGVSVIVPVSAEVKGNLQVGDMVKVAGTVQADGSVLADKIEKK